MSVDIVSVGMRLAKELVEKKMQYVGPAIEERLEQEMKQSIDSVVYSVGTSGDFDRTYAYRDAWKATATASGTDCHIEMKYVPTGSHPSVDGTSDVTGGLDEIVIHGSGPAVTSPANSGRDHFTSVEAKAPDIVREVICEYI